MRRIFTIALMYGTFMYANDGFATDQHQGSICFTENKGQIKDQFGQQRPDIDFQLKGKDGFNVFVGNARLHYQWNEIEKQDRLAEDANTINSYRVDVRLVGASTQAKLTRGGKLDYREFFYKSSQSALPAFSFQKLTYENVYPNIDWILYVNDEGKMEYDFLVRPGGRVEDIQIEFLGASSLEISQDGSLEISTPMGTVTENPPISYQGDGRQVGSRFVLDGNVLSFYTESYTGNLTIDPVLEWASYYGGSGSDLGRSVANDKSGGVYLAGTASSASFIATTGAHQVTYGGAPSDAMLVKFDSSGARLWATYFGGSGEDVGWWVACDESDNVYLAGSTTSASGISKNGFQSASGGKMDAFLAKFDSSGLLQWASYYGGTENDEARAVATDKMGHLYLAGRTFSSNNIATANAHQQNYENLADGFLVKFDTAGNRIWGTYFGGAGVDNTWAATCDREGNVYVSGETASSNGIATSGGHQTTITPTNGSEAFLIKFNAAGQVKWGTYYGGDQPNQAYGTGIACDDSNNVYMTGYTVSDVDIATPGSHQPTRGGEYDAFLVKFDSLGTRQWATYYGGDKTENGYGVACDVMGNVYITGYSNSKQNIATADGIQTSATAGNSNEFYVAKFRHDGVREWGTYYGTAGYDAGFSIAHDNLGNIYTAGFTNGHALATQNGFQTSNHGSFDAFIFRMSECFVPTPASLSWPDSVCPNTTQVFRVSPVPNAMSYTWQLPSGWSGTSSADSIIVTTGSDGGSISVLANAACGSGLARVIEVHVYNTVPAVINVEGFKLSTTSTYSSYQWLLNGNIMTGEQDSVLIVTQNGDYSVIVVDKNGCVDTSDVYKVTNVSAVGSLEETRKISVYPNPTTGALKIDAPYEVDALLFDVQGRKITSLQQDKSVDISLLEEGIYLLYLYDKNKSLIKIEKVLKKN